METSYQVIDRKTWKRNMHCQIFQNSLEPQYGISLELDITNFLKRDNWNGKGRNSCGCNQRGVGK